MKLWYCKIGEVAQLLGHWHGSPDGAMRTAVEAAYAEVTGHAPLFIFSGWGAELEEHERAVVEDREPDPAVIARDLHRRLIPVERQLVLVGHSQKSGVDLIAAERIRQIIEEGRTRAHDDQHTRAEMVSAALCYALAYTPRSPPGTGIVVQWPWDQRWWKPSDRIRNLAKAGALIAAEIDRLERANG